MHFPASLARVVTDRRPFSTFWIRCWLSSKGGRLGMLVSMLTAEVYLHAVPHHQGTPRRTKVVDVLGFRPSLSLSLPRWGVRLDRLQSAVDPWAVSWVHLGMRPAFVRTRTMQPNLAWRSLHHLASRPVSVKAATVQNPFFRLVDNITEHLSAKLLVRSIFSIYHAPHSVTARIVTSASDGQHP